MKLYNSASRQKEEFIPHEPGKVSMYTCGPTVYHFAHIGNLRSYIMEDVLEKALRWEGLNVTRVMNITIPSACGANREGNPVWSLLVQCPWSPG